MRPRDVSVVRVHESGQAASDREYTVPTGTAVVPAASAIGSPVADDHQQNKKKAKVFEDTERGECAGELGVILFIH